MAETKSGDFERAIERLEAIVKELEGGDAGLDESVRLFREGRELAKRCQSLLDDAQKSIDGSEPAATARSGELPF